MDEASTKDSDLSALSRAELEAHLEGLCSRYAATEYQLLCCIRECERRGGTLSHGMKSTAHWLNARFGIALGAAREKVRVAAALESLPEMSAALGAGDVSYSKVRAMSRIATPENEEDLLRLARESTASDLERMTREYHQLEHLDDPERPLIQHRLRRLGWYWDEDGMLVVEGRLPPEDGALFIKLIESMRDLLYREERSATQSAADASEEAGSVCDASGPSCADTPPEPTSASQRSLDALVRLVKTGSEGEPRHLTGPERTQVVLHVVVDEAGAASKATGENSAKASVNALANASAKGPTKARSLADSRSGALGGAEDEPAPSSPRSAVEAELQRRPRLAPGTVIPAETARRLCCDAARVLMVENAAGDPLSVSRQSRTVPWHIRKALEQRDGGCTFPGCIERRYVDAHHIRHWVDGGETSLANCTLLCRHHHRLVHEAGYVCERVGDRIVFRTPDGRELTALPQEADDAVSYQNGSEQVDVSAETSVRDGDASDHMWRRWRRESALRQVSAATMHALSAWRGHSGNGCV